MGLVALVMLLLEAAALWIVLQYILILLVDRVPAGRRVVDMMKTAEDFALVAGTTLGALLVLLPSFVFVVLEVFRYVHVRGQSHPAKTVADYMARVVDIVNELEGMGDRMRHAAVRLHMGDTETMVKCLADGLCNPR